MTEFELIEDDTSEGGPRRRRAIFRTEDAAQKYMDALTKVGALWIRQAWGWRTVPCSGGPVREIRRITPTDLEGSAP